MTCNDAIETFCALSGTELGREHLAAWIAELDGLVRRELYEPYGHPAPMRRPDHPAGGTCTAGKACTAGEACTGCRHAARPDAAHGRGCPDPNPHRADRHEYLNGDLTCSACELLIPPPWDELYLLWLRCKLESQNREYVAYNNAYAAFNTLYDSFANRFRRTHRARQRRLRV